MNDPLANWRNFLIETPKKTLATLLMKLQQCFHSFLRHQEIDANLVKGNIFAWIPMLYFIFFLSFHSLVSISKMEDGKLKLGINWMDLFIPVCLCMWLKHMYKNVDTIKHSKVILYLKVSELFILWIGYFADYEKFLDYAKFLGHVDFETNNFQFFFWLSLKLFERRLKVDELFGCFSGKILTLADKIEGFTLKGQ